MALGNEERINLLGVPLTNITEENFESVVLNGAQSSIARKVVFLDFKGFMRERKNLKKGHPSFLQEADLILTTSLSVAKAAEKLYGVTQVRFYPFYFVIKLLGILEKRNYSAYFLGGNSPELMKLVSHIRSTFNGIKIVGRYKGDYPKSEEKAVLTGIKKAGAHFMLVGSRIKAPEKWVVSVADYFKGLIVVSPEAFEVMAGKQKPESVEDWEKRHTHNFFSFLLPWNWGEAYSHVKFSLLVAIEKRKMNKAKKGQEN